MPSHQVGAASRLDIARLRRLEAELSSETKKSPAAGAPGRRRAEASQLRDEAEKIEAQLALDSPLPPRRTRASETLVCGAGLRTRARTNSLSNGLAASEAAAAAKAEAREAPEAARPLMSRAGRAGSPDAARRETPRFGPRRREGALCRRPAQADRPAQGVRRRARRRAKSPTTAASTTAWPCCRASSVRPTSCLPRRLRQPFRRRKSENPLPAARQALYAAAFGKRCELRLGDRRSEIANSGSFASGAGD